MRPLFFWVLGILIFSCTTRRIQSNITAPNQQFNQMLEQFHDESIRYSPLQATSIGDNRYYHILAIEFTDSYRAQLATFFRSYLTRLNGFDRATLIENDQLSFALFRWHLESPIEGLRFKDIQFPFTQFTGLPITLAYSTNIEANA